MPRYNGDQDVQDEVEDQPEDEQGEEENQDDQPEQEEEEPEEEEQPEEGEQEQDGEEGEADKQSVPEAREPRKKALLMGCNYPDTSSPLNGCINDAYNMKAFLLENGYEEENIVVLTDDQEDESLRPTKDNMLKCMQELVEGAIKGDSFVLQFAGHGDSEEDSDGDEHDGRDEIIRPCDYEENGNISDDTMHELLVKKLPYGSRLTAIFDCCHSGSALDLPYTYNEEGTIKEPTREDAMKNLAHHVANDDVSAIVKAAQALQLRENGTANAAHAIAMATRTAWADVYYISGCLDEQTSADTVENDQSTGAMTWGLIRTLRENPEQTYKTLLQGIHDAMVEKEYRQRPQLSTSYPMDLNRPFVI